MVAFFGLSLVARCLYFVVRCMLFVVHVGVGRRVLFSVSCVRFCCMLLIDCRLLFGVCCLVVLFVFGVRCSVHGVGSLWWLLVARCCLWLYVLRVV